MTLAQKAELAEIILRTRHWAFHNAWPEITEAVRRMMAEAEERQRGADRMIVDYRRIIRGTEWDI